jgi:hypothetical protein
MKINPDHAEQAVKTVVAAADKATILALLEGFDYMLTYGDKTRQDMAIKLFALCYIEVGKLQAQQSTRTSTLGKLQVYTAEGALFDEQLYEVDMHGRNAKEVATKMAAMPFYLGKLYVTMPYLGRLPCKSENIGTRVGTSGQLVFAAGQLRLDISDV